MWWCKITNYGYRRRATYLGYFSIEFFIDGFTVSANAYVKKYVAREIVIRINVINKFDLSIEQDGSVKGLEKREYV